MAIQHAGTTTLTMYSNTERDKDAAQKSSRPGEAHAPSQDVARCAYSAEVTLAQPNMPSVLGCLCTTQRVEACHAALLQSRERLLVVNADHEGILGEFGGESLHVRS
jgi:hypothetical protein